MAGASDRRRVGVRGCSMKHLKWLFRSEFSGFENGRCVYKLNFFQLPEYWLEKVLYKLNRKSFWNYLDVVLYSLKGKEYGTAKS